MLTANPCSSITLPLAKVIIRIDPGSLAPANTEVMMNVEKKDAATVVLSLADGAPVRISSTSDGVSNGELHLSMPEEYKLWIRPNVGNTITIRYERVGVHPAPKVPPGSGHPG